jgi:hypothetical protein
VRNGYDGKGGPQSSSGMMGVDGGVDRERRNRISPAKMTEVGVGGDNGEQSVGGVCVGRDQGGIEDGGQS